MNHEIEIDRGRKLTGSNSMWLRVTVPTIGLFILSFGGYVKGTWLLVGLPFDITLAAAAVVLAASIGRVLTPGRLYEGVAVCMVLLLLAALMLGLMRVPLNSYGTAKQFDILVVIPTCLLGGLTLLDSRQSRRVWLIAAVIFGPLVILVALLDPSPLSDGLLWPMGGSTIGVGRSAGAALVVVWASLIYRGRSFTAAALLPVLAGGLVLSGSRGPLAAALVAMAAMSLLSTARNRRAAVRWFLTACAALIVALLIGASIPEKLTSLSDASATIRFQLWAQTLSLSLEHPLLGIGWGNLYSYQNGIARLDSGFIQYPHNIALEIASEAGLVAFSVFSVVVLVAVWRQRQAARVDGVGLAMFGLLLFYLVNALASGDVDSNRELWIAIGFGVGAIRDQSASPKSPRSDRVERPAEPPQSQERQSQMPQQSTAALPPPRRTDTRKRPHQAQRSMKT